MRAMKLKLYPTKQQAMLIKLNIDNARFVYNHCLTLNKELYEATKEHLNHFDMNKHITMLKSQDEYEWLKQSNSQVLQQSLKRLDLAYKAFFRRIKQGDTPGFPKFRSKYDTIQSISYPQGIKFNNVYSKVYIPKIGYIKVRGYRKDITGDIKTSILKSLGNNIYTLSITVDYKNQESTNEWYVNNKPNAIGIDVGVKKIVTDSNSNMIKPMVLTPYINNIKHIQAKLATMKKRTCRYRTIKNKLSKAYRKYANVKLNFLHHIANQYVGYKVVYVEDLRISKMTKNIKGTVDNPIYESKQKSNLNNRILQQSWGTLFELLEYKLKEHGSMLVKVAPEYTSQMCSKCGNIDKASRDRENYICTACGHKIDADHNAAINILNKGIHGNSYGKVA